MCMAEDLWNRHIASLSVPGHIITNMLRDITIRNKEYNSLLEYARRRRRRRRARQKREYVRTIP